MDFSHYTDEPVDLSVSLMNTKGRSSDSLTTLADLNAFLEPYHHMWTGVARPPKASEVEKVRALRPDIVVMYVQMPRAGGVEGVRAIRQAGFDAKIVMLTVSEDDEDLFESIKAGANGYLLKNTRPEQLFDDLRGLVGLEADHGPAPHASIVPAAPVR